jgi:hypothetical protein
VRHLPYLFSKRVPLTVYVQHKRGPLLLLREARAARMGAARKLDHRLGERHRPSYARLLDRLHMVRLAFLHFSEDYSCWIDSALMITSAITVGSDGAIVLSAGATYGILLAILFMHGLVCSAATKVIARLNLFYTAINGASVHTLIALATSNNSIMYCTSRHKRRSHHRACRRCGRQPRLI